MLAWLFGSDTKRPIFLKFRSSKTFIIVTVSSAVFTDIFAYGIVVPVFPFAITSRAGIHQDDVQTWISILLAVYGAALLVCSPIVGWAADRTSGRQIPFLVGLILLGASTAMLCVGDSIALYLVGRILQGASAAVVWVVGLALLVDTCGADEIGTAMGYVSLSLSLAILLAPLLGGVVFASSGYYPVYAMAFGLIVLDVILRLAMVEKKHAVKWLQEVPSSKAQVEPDQSITLESDMERVPDIEKTTAPPEINASIHKLDEPACAIQRLPSHAPSTAAEAAAAEHAPTAIKKFVERLPPVIFLFGSRRLLCALWACTIQSTLFTSFDSILPLYVRKIFHWNSTGAGLIFLPIVIGTFLGPIVGRLSDKYGPRWFATAGFIVSCPFLILLRLVDHEGIRQKVLLCALLFLVGIGLTLALTPVMAEIAYAVEAKARRHPPGFFGENGAYAQAYALFNMAWAAGAMLGPLLAGLVANSQGWATATLILGCVSAITAVPTAIWTGGSIFKKRKQEQVASG